jgi:hypothetical protein
VNPTAKATFLAATCLLFCAAAAPRGGENGKVVVPAGAKDVLKMGSYWRWHVTLRRPMVSEGGKLVLLKRSRVNYRNYNDHLQSPPPPDGWARADFDDSSWPRSPAGAFRSIAFGRFSSARVCLRGKFAVTNPSAVSGLYLTMKYRGGVVVYLNGQEVKRAHLPKGELKPETAAELYPKEAYVDSGGKPIAGSRHWKKLSAEKKKDLASRVARRNRALGPLELPRKLLRRGVNVIGLEIRRSDYHSSARQWFTGAWVRKGPWWVPCNLLEVKLQAAGAGAVPNTSRPAGLRIWNCDLNDRVSLKSYGDPNEKLAPVRMFGARNGTFAGKVVLSSTAAISGVRVKPGELKGPKGTIPAESVSVLYGRLDMSPYGKVPWYQGLGAKPPANVAPDKRYRGANLPIWIKVGVPREAGPGLYKGVTEVTASGRSFKVPVEVSVSDWTLPDPRNYRTYVGIYQSPTSVAMQYKVEPWSEKHWKLLERSFELLGRVGNKMVNIPVVDETQFGNPEGMITWIKKKDGGYDYDYSVFDRYLKLAVKHCGKLDYVCLQVWHAGGWKARSVNNKCTVQVRDGKDGKSSPVQVPLWGKPEAAAFWKSFFAKTQERLAKLGMPKAMTVGILSCSTAPNEVFKTVSEAWPGGAARWHRGCHVTTGAKAPYRVSKVGDNRVSLHEHCYGMSMVKPDVAELPPLHQYRGRPGTAYFRVSSHMVTSTFLSARTMTERGLWCGKQGIGRICLDFWPVMRGKRGARDIYNRYPHSSCAQREPSLKRMTWPGPAGAEPDTWFELFALGLQETEAVMLLSEAAGGKAGGDLAGRSRKLLRERLMFCHSRNICRWNNPFYEVNHGGWGDLAKRTFDLAGEFARKTGK